MRRGELEAALRLVWREYQLSCRGAAFWAIAAAAALLAFWRSSWPGVTAALAAYQAWSAVVLGLAVIAILVAGSTAARDRREGSLELVLPKPMGGSPSLAAARFVGLWLSLLTLVVVALAAASVRQALGPAPWRLGPYANAFARSLAPMGLAAALGFALTSLVASPLAAGVGALYWVAVPLTRTDTPQALDMTLAQQWPAAALLAAGLVALSAGVHGKSLEGVGPRRGRLLQVSAALLAAGVLLSVRFALGGEDALTRRDPVLSAMASQQLLADQRAPGFWASAGGGRVVGLSDFAGRPVALAFWSPAAPESAEVLGLLQQGARKFGPEGAVFIAVCIDRDSAAAGPFAAEAPEVVMLWDRGQHYGRGEPWCDSPLNYAYDVRGIPTVYLLDRDRALVERVEYQSAEGLERALRRLVEER